MRHPLTSLLPALSLLVIFIDNDYAKGQTLSAIDIPGYKLHRVGCFGETTPPSGAPTLLFSDTKANSETKVDYKDFGNYLRDVVARCARAAAAKNYNFCAVHSVGNCYSGKDISTTYAKNGPSKNCLNGDGKACVSNQDCVGRENSTFVYKLQSLTTTPTTKPTSKPTGASTTGGATTQSPTAASAFSTLTCLSYLVAIKATAGGAVTKKPNIPTPGATTKPTVKAMATASSVATTGTSSPTPSVKTAVEAKVKAIYKGYSCLVCLKTVNVSTSAVYLTLKFTCPGQHLKKLVAGLGASNIIKAVCYPPPPCTYGSFVSPPCPSPCGVSSCVTVPPSLKMPPICTSPPVTVTVPAPFPPPRCPAPCPITCAPACNPVCCSSAIHSKKRTGPSAKKSSTESEDDDIDPDVEDDDNVDFDE